MSLKIIEHKKNPLMKAEEVKALLEHAGKPTPKREDILPSLESVLKKSGELIVIDKIFTKKGRCESLVRALVYEKKEDVPKLRKKEGKGKKAGAEEKKEGKA
jgi:ribosomal protein S24E